MTVPPLTSERYFLESCTKGVLTLSMAMILSSCRRPAAEFSDALITESITNGTARSNTPGVLSTAPIFERSM